MVVNYYFEKMLHNSVFFFIMSTGGCSMDITVWKNRKKELHLNYDEIAQKAGVSKRTVEDIFRGYTTTPRIDTVQAIERALGLSSSSLASNIYDVGEILVFDEIGTVAAGFDNSVDEIPTGRKIEIPASMLHGGKKDDYFVLRVKGDSMYPRLLDGDTILCKRCDSVDSGSLAVVLYNGDEATVKKVHYVYGEDWLELIPFNPEYKTKRIEKSDLQSCRVLGLVVKLIRDL